MNRLKLICGVSLALLLVAGTVWALSRRDYRVYWTATDGTVIGGITSAGKLDTLAGASFGGDVDVAGDLDVTGALTTESGVNWTAPLEVGGALSASGDIGFGTDYGKFTIESETGDTVISGTLDVTGATTLGSTLGVDGATTLGSTLAVTGAITSGVNGASGTAGGLTINNGGDPGDAVFTVAGDTGNVELAGAIGIGTYIVLGASDEPQTPEVDTLILWFDGTNLLVKDNAGQTESLTSWVE